MSPKPIIVLIIGMLMGSGMLWAAQSNFQRQPKGAELLGEVDRGFLADMSVHHDQAVTLGTIALQNGGPEVRVIAMSIVAGQMEEMGRMRGWLAMNGRAELPTDPGARWMTRSADPEAMAFAALCARGAMPGMATADEIDDFRRRSGDDFDVRFLQLMIRHHQGALPMARFAAREGELDLVRQLATRIAYEQPREVAAMLRQLLMRHGKPLPPELGLPPLGKFEDPGSDRQTFEPLSESH